MNSKLQRMANSNTTILITGKTGTGKSHLAKEIHDMSSRKAERFVSVNLATLSENLIESELFGHERGSFSGADSKRIGKLEWANRGTVFLDEIGELPLHTQAKLLEALNSRTVIPVGSNREIQLDIRIITATNRPLEQMVAEGKFRQDLFYRINSFQIHLPELHGNKEKIESLAKGFARDSAQIRGFPTWNFGEGFLPCLFAHSWPGNVRELKNTIEYAFALSCDGNLLPEHLPPLHSSAENTKFEDFLFPSNYRSAKEFFERKYLQHVLWRFEGKINLTAKESGLSKVTLIEKIRKYEINIPEIKYQTHLIKLQQGAL
jgi:transcriptional regulator with PAS, ATPase and Fis domain